MRHTWFSVGGNFAVGSGGFSTPAAGQGELDSEDWGLVWMLMELRGVGKKGGGN
jgi:hypothetical protein